MLHQLRLIGEALPWTLPAVAGGAVLALLTMVLFPKRRSHSDRIGFALVLWCLVVALAVTLSPVKNAYFGVPTWGCNLQVWRPLDYHYWLSAGSRPPNVWLLLPGGIGIMLLDGFWRRLLALGFFVALPPGIEALQDAYPELKRSCSSQDIVDNWTGLALGLGVGAVLMIFIGLARLARRRSERARRAGVAPDLRDRPGAREEEPAKLPLGGGRRGGYSDFGDFDDSPRSTRWWAQSEQDETHAMPERVASHDPQTGGGHGSAQSEENRAEGAGSSVDATQVMPQRSRGDRRDGPGVDETQIIPRG